METYRGYSLQYDMTERGYDVTIRWTAPEMSLGSIDDIGMIVHTRMFDLNAVQDIMTAYLDEEIAAKDASFKIHVELIEKALLA